LTGGIRLRCFRYFCVPTHAILSEALRCGSQGGQPEVILCGDEAQLKPIAAGSVESVISAIEVGDKAVRIIGCKDVLQAVIAGKQTANENVRGFVRKWRARRDSNS